MRNANRTIRRIGSVVLTCAVLLGALGFAAAPAPVAAQLPPNCAAGPYLGGQYLICVPPAESWNGDLVVFAHGYVAPENDLVIPQDQLVLPDGTNIPQTVIGMGYAFAATSYRTNGLAVENGVEDLEELVAKFKELTDPDPTNTYLVGASEGGLITALAAEQSDVFSGALATSGPVGDFRRQINYWGDVRVLFDVFFPGVLPKFKDADGPLIQEDVMNQWYWCDDPEWNTNYGCADKEKNAYEVRVREALMKKRGRTKQLLEVARVPTKDGDFEANVEALVELLWYNVFATNDAVEKLGGQPYDNSDRWYTGPGNDRKLNGKVERFEAEPNAVKSINDHYQTSGDLNVPIVTMHTVKDPIVPYWHEPLYRAKVWRSRAWREHTNLPIFDYGHCNFSQEEVLFAFGLLRYQVSGETPW